MMTIMLEMMLVMAMVFWRLIIKITVLVFAILHFLSFFFEFVVVKFLLVDIVFPISKTLVGVRHFVFTKISLHLIIENNLHVCSLLFSLQRFNQTMYVKSFLTRVRNQL
jgi:hypothetical protein